jgi:branched-chain amino acid transport system substrate-binding protein
VRIRTSSRVAAALVAATAVLLAACGTRVDHDAIVQAAGAPATQQEGAGNAGFGDGEAGDQAGSSEDVDGDEEGSSAGSADSDGAASGKSGEQGSGGSDPGSTGEQGGSSGKPIVIGTIGAFSGPGGAALAQGARAMQVWAADVNARGGIDGRPVKLIVVDDGGDAAKARSLMKELVEDRKAVAVVAAMTVVETLNAWRGYVEDKKVPIVGGSCGPEWTASPMLFRQCPASPEQIFGTALIGAKHGKSKQFGGLFCSETESCTFVENQLFAKGGAERAGLNPRYRGRMSVFQADYTAECIQARNSGVELMMVVADPGTTERVAASCRRQGFTPQYLQISSTIRAGTVAKPGMGDMLVGMSSFPFAGMSGKAFGEFDAAWKRHGGGQAPGPAASQGWASGKLFELAARKAGSDLSRASLVKALRTLRDERLGGLTTPMTFGPKGPADVKCTYYMKGSGGKWTAPEGAKLTCW